MQNQELTKNPAAPRRNGSKPPADWSTTKRWREAEKWVDGVLASGRDLHIALMDDGYWLQILHLYPDPPSEKPFPGPYPEELKTEVRIILTCRGKATRYTGSMGPVAEA